MNNIDFLKVAEALAKEAGALCLEIQKDLGDVRYKSKKDVVTRADIASEKLIVDGLRKAFPEHSIRTEEAGVILDEHGWTDVQDLIDGVNRSGGHFLDMEKLED